MADNPITVGATAQAFNPAKELCWSAPTSAAGANRACGTPAAGATGYSYNATGARTLKTPAAGPATTYGYDGADRLTSITGGVSATYSYDGDGLRTAKTTGGVSSSFGWNDESGIALLLRDRNDYYVYGPDGVPLERLGDGPTLYLHTDQQDSVRLATDGAGNAACTASYTPWGAVTWTKKPGYTGSTPNLGYNSQYSDPETGYIYLRARYYDPATAQFLTRDPAEAATRSAYGYTANNPLNGADPSGLSTCGEASLGGLMDCGAKAVDTTKNELDCATDFSGTQCNKEQHANVQRATETGKQLLDAETKRVNIQLFGCAFVCIMVTYDRSNSLRLHLGFGPAIGAGGGVAPGTANCDPNKQAFFNLGPLGVSSSQPSPNGVAPEGSWSSPVISWGPSYPRVGGGVVKWFCSS